MVTFQEIQTGTAEERVAFVTTQWSVVLAAGEAHSPEAEAALTQLCRTYWYPIYAYLRRSGQTIEDAQDLTQEFFARLIEKKDLSRVGREKGRFRSFLLVCLKHFVVNEVLRAKAQKRGGGQRPIPLDEILAESRYQLEPSHNVTAEIIYERRWALTLLEQVLGRLREEYKNNRKEPQFQALKVFLSAESGTQTCAQIGAELQLSEGAVRVAVHRLRRRYLELLRDEIAQTVAHPAEVEDELRYLLKVLNA